MSGSALVHVVVSGLATGCIYALVALSLLATLVAVNAVVAIGLNLRSGYTNQLSFSTG